MAIPFLSPIDMGRNEVTNLRIQNLASAPTHGAGIIYYDTGTNLLGVSNGTTWTYLQVGGTDTEAVQDIVGAMGSGSSVVTATYNDGAGTVVYTIGTGQIVDAMVSGSAAINADKIADGTTNHVFTASDDTKLAGIATGATANDTDANLKARANHTGTQTASTISDFTTAVNALIANVVDAAPAALDTLNELAASLADDADFAGTMTTALAAKANTSSLASVATAGTYASLTSKPTYSTTVGDGAETVYVITHSLGTRNVDINLYLTGTPWTHYEVQKASTSTTTVTLTFATAPTTDLYTVYISAA